MCITIKDTKCENIIDVDDVDMTYTCPYCNTIYEIAPKSCSCTPYSQPSDSFMLRSENIWEYEHLTKEQYQMCLDILAAKRGKPVSEFIRSKIDMGKVKTKTRVRATR